jgi:cellulose synthase/poly-beta-1,6-N-acetylglucosamine synthase-like glycosyltransferase
MRFTKQGSLDKIDETKLLRSFNLIAVVVLFLVLLGTIVFRRNLNQATTTALDYKVSPSKPQTEADSIFPPIAVVIPAYNEAENIRECVLAVLAATQSSQMQVWVVDDQSIDPTLAIVQALQQELGDPRLQVLASAPRPQGEIWVGKNWACFQATQQIQTEFLLFLDADVRLKLGAIEGALQVMQSEQVDLLTVLPTIVCGCLGEWLAQPLIISLLAVGLSFAEVNDPESETVFAVGPFMLFRRNAYESLGGHLAVASEVVEDVELARRIKQKGLKLKYGLGHDLAAVQMYRSAATLWEGWTKNWYLGSRRNLLGTLYTAAIVLWTCTGPWLGLLLLLGTVVTSGVSLLHGLAIALALASIALHYWLRCDVERLAAIPRRYWWLTGVGGVFVAAIAIASIIKTETGWGWTWRGRSLKQG